MADGEGAERAGLGVVYEDEAEGEWMEMDAQEDERESGRKMEGFQEEKEGEMEDMEARGHEKSVEDRPPESEARDGGEQQQQQQQQEQLQQSPSGAPVVPRVPAAVPAAAPAVPSAAAAPAAASVPASTARAASAFVTRHELFLKGLLCLQQRFSRVSLRLPSLSRYNSS
eukprot:TRINITY_DN7041_c0_g1_i1.p1 TRINITY_DN7041_c0_g1~~TRINITY_DN7041_c0_g1_i1.p1  ORF type:complete len:185 (-),score=25.42 TRINITY_DN7041_c0_g1_i1:163-672(-)